MRTSPAFRAHPPPPGGGMSPRTTRGEVSGCPPGPACPIRKPRLSSPAELLTEGLGTMLRGRRRVRVFARLLTRVPAVTHFICPLWSPAGIQPDSRMHLTPTRAPCPAAALAVGPGSWSAGSRPFGCQGLPGLLRAITEEPRQPVPSPSQAQRGGVTYQRPRNQQARQKV